MATVAEAYRAIGWLEEHFKNPPTAIELEASREEGIKHVETVGTVLKKQWSENFDMTAEVAQLKSEISQTQKANTKAKENEDWKRLVYIDTDEEGHAFVYVTVDLGEDFAAGEAFTNAALQVEFEPKPDVALTIQYLDAISTLLKNKAHELPARNV